MLIAMHGLVNREGRGGREGRGREGKEGRKEGRKLQGGEIRSGAVSHSLSLSHSHYTHYITLQYVHDAQHHHHNHNHYNHNHHPQSQPLLLLQPATTTTITTSDQVLLVTNTTTTTTNTTQPKPSKCVSVSLNATLSANVPTSPTALINANQLVDKATLFKKRLSSSVMPASTTHQTMVLTVPQLALASSPTYPHHRPQAPVTRIIKRAFTTGSCGTIMKLTGFHIFFFFHHHFLCYGSRSDLDFC